MSEQATPQLATKDELGIVAHNLKALDDRLSAGLERLRQEPGPYAELVARVSAIEDASDVLRRVQGSLEVLIDRQTTPQLTVRHWLSDDGKHWLYETTVSLKPESLEAMPNTLAWVDEMARAESRRREGVDRG